jgi:hypothetical protein
MIMFYSSSGNGHLFHVSVEPQSSKGDAPESCIISLALVQATLLKNAVLPDGRAKVIVSADQWLTVHVLPEFEKMYGYLWSEIAGRTLGFITGPNINMALLLKLLNSARNGHSETDSFFTYTRAGDEIFTVIQVKPVVDGGVVSHMVVVCSIVGDIAGHCLQASSGGKSEQVETSKETSVEDVSEEASEEMLVRKRSQSQKARSAHLHSREQHLHHGKTSSEAAEAFSRIKWRQVPVTKAHSRMCSFKVPYQHETVWETEALACPLPVSKPILLAADQRADLTNAATVLASDASAMQLWVGLTAPFRIYGANSAFFDMFQLSAATCISRSLSLVQGPETNVKLLFSLFEIARVGRGANAMIMFYSSSGNGHLFHVAVEPQSSKGDAPESCIISLALVQATETSAEDVSEEASEEMLVPERSHSEQARSTHLHLKKQHLHHGKTSSEAVEAFSRIMWRQVPVKKALSRTVQLHVHTDHLSEMVL